MKRILVLCMAAAIACALGCGGSGTGGGTHDVDADAGPGEVRGDGEVTAPPDTDASDKGEVPEDLPQEGGDAADGTDAEAEHAVPWCLPGDGCFGDKCAQNAQCLSGLCVELMGEGVCTITCEEECPQGWTCRQVSDVGPDVVWACVSAFANLCKPCSAGADCKSPGGADDVCVSYGQEGYFCGGKCTQDEDCPWSFSCQDAVTIDGLAAKQCVADTGLCPCTDKAVERALWTPCKSSNEWGTCEGKRVCGEEGLSACSAPVPAAETCNGGDDDCDGDTDEPDADGDGLVPLCDDGNACTEDKCNAADGCDHAALAEGDCNDGDACTAGDHCQAGTCLGDQIPCDDANPCTDDQCGSGGGCEFVPNSAACDDGNPCTVADVCSNKECGGIAVACDCVADADCAALEDGDLCNGTLVCDTSKLPYQCVVDAATLVSCPPPGMGPDAFCAKAACDPGTGSCGLAAANEGYPCDDGNACTIGDKCAGMKCISGILANCNDGDACTLDSCDPASGCMNEGLDAECSDGDACTAGDKCEAGICVPGEVQSCDDGNPCTTDACLPASGCQHSPQAGACDDGNPCTTGETCKAGLCQPKQAVVCNDWNVCTDDACDPEDGDCQFIPNAAQCDDDDVCTTGDHCNGGLCVSSGALDCDDLNPCNVDSCDPAGGCTYLVLDDGTWCGPSTWCEQGECAGANVGGATAALAAGEMHACLLREDGSVVCFGHNQYGQLGIGMMSPTRTWPAEVLGLHDVTRIDSRLNYGCALTADGKVSCWGGNAYGQLGDGTKVDSSMPLPVEGMPGATDVATGVYHACAVAGGEVYCWGYNVYGQVGDGTTADRPFPSKAVGLAGVEDVAAGDNHTCAVTKTGEVLCWGFNGYGQLGTGAPQDMPVPSPVKNLGNALRVVAGTLFTCVLRADGTVACWGYNGSGQLGTGSYDNAGMPAEVPNLAGVKALSAGVNHVCALKADGTVWCWGYNAYGQLGDGGTTQHNLPHKVVLLDDAVAVAAGTYHTCARRQDASVKCWGYNAYGQLGDGTTNGHYEPVWVEGLTPYWHAPYCSDGNACTDDVLVPGGCQHDPLHETTPCGPGQGCAAGKCGPAADPISELALGYSHTCAQLAGGRVGCWGRNEIGELGQGKTFPHSLVALDVPGIDDASALSADNRQTCAVRSQGKASCWGANPYGELGNGTTAASALPVSPLDLPAVRKISMGVNHTCALRADGQVVCWGYNGYGQLGDGTTIQRVQPAEPVSDLAEVFDVAAGGGHACAVAGPGRVWCWGYNGYGQLGNGLTQGSTVPVEVAPGTGLLFSARRVVAGENFSCALAVDGTAACWGYNGYGQLGCGDSQSRTVPAAVVGLDAATALAAGGSHACALKADGTVWCWGYNGNGQLGDTTTANRLVPVKVFGLKGAVDIAAASYHTCARLVDGSIRCWGLNDYGQLGGQTMAGSLEPVPVASLDPWECAACDDGSACTEDDCAADGSCLHVPLPNGTPCGASKGCDAGSCKTLALPQPPIAVGYDHSCVRRADGRVACFGRNEIGELGLGVPSGLVTFPTDLPGVVTAAGIAANHRQSCMPLQNGKVMCWGYNEHGELGNGTTLSSASPVQAGALSSAVRVSNGLSHACAVLSSGKAMCWGYNGHGQLGDGTVLQRTQPVEVEGLAGVAHVAAGGSHSCAVSAGGKVSCWGYSGYGQVGNGLTANSSVPLPVAPGTAGLKSALRVVAGEHFSCALETDGTVACWGYNGYGQLGDGSVNSSVVPVPVAGLKDVRELAAGANYVCAVRSDDTVWCWGYNGNGQLGDATTASRTTPVKVFGLSGVDHVAACYGHTCALKKDGSVFCWGANAYGQLGTGMMDGSLQPVEVLALDSYSDCSKCSDGNVCTDDVCAADGACSHADRPDGTPCGPNKGCTAGVCGTLALSQPGVATGARHTCFTWPDGRVGCWGRNELGELGAGYTSVLSAFPLEAQTLTSASGVTASGRQTCALTKAGKAMCWGYNEHGELGNKGTVNAESPQFVSNLSNAVRVSSGLYHTCALRADGHVVCWGYNGYGQLGDGTAIQRLEPGEDVIGLEAAADVSAGSHHTCAIRAGGAVECWGYNGYGQLGNGNTVNQSSPVAVAPGAAQLWHATRVSAGDGFTCAVMADGRVACWGYNGYGQLGDGTTTQRVTPVLVSGLAAVAEIAAGGTYVCALNQDQTVWCWGYNGYGQLGDGTTTPRPTPVKVLGVAGAVAVSAEESHTCVLKSNGSVLCWGLNDYGQLGTGVMDSSLLPVPPVGLSTYAWCMKCADANPCTDDVCNADGSCAHPSKPDQTPCGQAKACQAGLCVASSTPVVRVSAGDGHSCARKPDGSVKCWGRNDLGQLGRGTATPTETTAGPVTGVAGAVDAASANHSTCAALSGGGVRCWGYNGYGQLGNGSTADAATPVVTANLSDAVKVAEGVYHTCALESDGHVICWGYNAYGQLGDGTTAPRTSPLEPVQGVTTAFDVAAGNLHSCAIVSGGRVVCWGYNGYGQLGNGSTAGALVPVAVAPGYAGLWTARKVAAGGDSTCVAKTDGTVACWGYNAYGQLGNGTAVSSTVPVAVAGLGTVSEVAMGAYHACAIKLDGTMWCWGSNGYGQLGDGGAAQHPTPVQVKGFTNGLFADAESGHTCAMKKDNSLWCWGFNAYGQLGNAGTETQYQPVQVVGW